MGQMIVGSCFIFARGAAFLLASFMPSLFAQRLDGITSKKSSSSSRLGWMRDTEEHRLLTGPIAPPVEDIASPLALSDASASLVRGAEERKNEAVRRFSVDRTPNEDALRRARVGGADEEQQQQQEKGPSKASPLDRQVACLPACSFACSLAHQF